MCCAQWVMQAFLKRQHLTPLGQVRDPEPQVPWEQHGGKCRARRVSLAVLSKSCRTLCRVGVSTGGSFSMQVSTFYTPSISWSPSG